MAARSSGFSGSAVSTGIPSSVSSSTAITGRFSSEAGDTAGMSTTAVLGSSSMVMEMSSTGGATRLELTTITGPSAPASSDSAAGSGA